MPSDLASAANRRGPHLLYDNVFGAEAVAALLRYVAERECDFTLAEVRRRDGGRHRTDRAVRNCYRLADLGDFAGLFRARLNRIAARALRELGLFESAVEPREFEICAYGNGGHFTPHIDTFGSLKHVRILSCVYYFAVTPRRFSGGVLRLYSLPRPSAGGRLAPHADIMPETDSLVVFPSWLLHEVLPVKVPSGDWTHGRFTINCWIHRVGASAGAASMGA
jgi:SM-20-related protein